jgi:histidinol dehydrogenase
LVKKLDARGRDAGEIVAGLRRSDGFLSASVREAARAIVEGVREGGDAALLDYTERFDGVRPENLRVPAEEIEHARDSLSAELAESFAYAIENVRSFHRREMERSWEQSRGGATVGQRVRPIRRAGLYIRACTPPGRPGRRERARRRRALGVGRGLRPWRGAGRRGPGLRD